MKIPCISIHQPFAGLIAIGRKTIETRIHNRLKCLRGHWVLIHATKAKPLPFPIVVHPPSEWCSIRGAIIAVAYVYNERKLNTLDSMDACYDCSDNDLYGLFLSNMQTIEPIYRNGGQGIWYYDLDIKQYPELSFKKEGDLL